MFKMKKANHHLQIVHGISFCKAIIILIVTSVFSTSTALSQTRNTSTTPSAKFEMIQLSEEPELDPQRIAMGMNLGPGWITNRGSGAGVWLAHCALTATFGLGPGGSRSPFSIDAYVGFSATPAVFTGSVYPNPNRFTELGVHWIVKPQTQFFERRWFAVGAGLVFTSWGTRTPLCTTSTQNASCDSQSGELNPAAVLDLGFGVYEWLSRRGRLGLALRTPIQLSSHPGVGAMFYLYGQIGFGR